MACWKRLDFVGLVILAIVCFLLTIGGVVMIHDEFQVRIAPAPAIDIREWGMSGGARGGGGLIIITVVVFFMGVGASVWADIKRRSCEEET